jgi:putative signal transducing protein
VKEKDTADWVEVASVGDDEEAYLIAGLLTAAGIPTQVEGPAVTPFPEDLGTFGMSRVMVPPDREEEAREVLARADRDRKRGRSSSKDREE